MSGIKTWAAGVTLIFGGLAQIASVIASGEFSFGEIQSGITMVGGGLGMIGIGHKIEKAAAKK